MGTKPLTSLDRGDGPRLQAEERACRGRPAQALIADLEASAAREEGPQLGRQPGLKTGSPGETKEGHEIGKLTSHRCTHSPEGIREVSEAVSKASFKERPHPEPAPERPCGVAGRFSAEERSHEQNCTGKQ